MLGATNATSVCSPICGDGKIKGSEALIILQLYHPGLTIKMTSHQVAYVIENTSEAHSTGFLVS